MEQEYYRLGLEIDYHRQSIHEYVEYFYQDHLLDSSLKYHSFKKLIETVIEQFQISLAAALLELYRSSHLHDLKREQLFRVLYEYFIDLYACSFKSILVRNEHSERETVHWPFFDAWICAQRSTRIIARLKEDFFKFHAYLQSSSQHAPDGTLSLEDLESLYQGFQSIRQIQKKSLLSLFRWTSQASRRWTLLATLALTLVSASFFTFYSKKSLASSDFFI